MKLEKLLELLQGKIILDNCADDDLKTAKITLEEEIYNHTCFDS